MMKSIDTKKPEFRKNSGFFISFLD